MQKVFVTDIRPNQDVESTFIVSDKQLRTAKTGTPFLNLKLVDKTGEILGRIWDNAESVDELVSVGSPVHLRGRSQLFRDELQIQIQRISPLALSDIDPSDFIPVGPVDPEELYQRFLEILRGMKRRSLRLLAKQFLEDRQLMHRFKLAPAAKSIHHAYLGGLIQHTVSIMELACRIHEQYPELDRDMLIMGAFLHDIGKVDEFVYNLIIDYSDAGRLLGHIMIGVEILEEKIARVEGFPPEEAIMLKHIILSHHGEAQFGAVKLPMTREAFAIHFADDLDAKMNTLGRILSDLKEDGNGWSTYQSAFQRYFFRGFSVAPGTGAHDGGPGSDDGEERPFGPAPGSPDRTK